MENKISNATAEQGNIRAHTFIHEAHNDVKRLKRSNDLLSSMESNASNKITSKEILAKKIFKMKDLDLLNTKNKHEESEENKHINILNEHIYIQTDPSNLDKFSIDTEKNRLRTVSKNKRKTNLNFVTQEKRLVNIIQLHDRVYSNNTEFNNNTFHTKPSQNEIYAGEANKNSKFKSMQNYNNNMDYYKYKSEIDKKHMLNAEFNMKKQFEFLIKQPIISSDKDLKNFDEASKYNISHLVRISPKMKLEDDDVKDAKSKIYAEMIDNYKIYDRQDEEKIEECVNKNSALKRAKKNVNFENAQGIEEKLRIRDKIELENKLILEHKKPKDFLLMLSKKAESSNSINSVKVYKNDYGDSAYQSKPSFNSNKKEKDTKSKNYLQDKFNSDDRLTKIAKEEYHTVEGSQANKSQSTIFHKNAQTEINYKLDKQRKEIESLFNFSKKNNIKTEADPAQAYKNIYFNMNRTLVTKKDSMISNEKDNSFEKYKNYLNKLDRFDENLNEAAVENKNKNKKNNSNKANLIMERMPSNNDLPVIYEKNAFLDKKQSSNKSNVDIVSYQKPKDSNEIFEASNKDENKQLNVVHQKNNGSNKTNSSYSKKNILEINSYNLDNPNQFGIQYNLTTTNKGSRYINPITNNIHSLADIEILDKKSYVTKLLKPFTPDISVGRFNSSHNKPQSELKNRVADTRQNNKELISEINTHYLKNNLNPLNRINSITTDNISTYLKETCPTEVTYSVTVNSKDRNNFNSSRVNKLNKIKKLEKKMNIGKIKKLQQLKNDISLGFGNMVNLEDRIKNRVNDSTQEFRNKLDKIQEKHYGTYKHEWYDPKVSVNL